MYVCVCVYIHIYAYMHIHVYICICTCTHPPPTHTQSPQVALVVKHLPANAGDIREAGLIPLLGRFPGGGRVNALQYSCLENPMDGGAWQAIVHGVARSRTRLKRLSRRNTREKITSKLVETKHERLKDFSSFRQFWDIT